MPPLMLTLRKAILWRAGGRGLGGASEPGTGTGTGTASSADSASALVFERFLAHAPAFLSGRQTEARERPLGGWTSHRHRHRGRPSGASDFFPSATGSDRAKGVWIRAWSSASCAAGC